jgi:WS/DGAT/MGAT family acyltransferase
MRQLRGDDARFVYAESGHANSNITLVSIYDPSTAPGGRVRYSEFLKHIESRLHRSPIFRQKLLRVPLELDYPYWIEDERFDLEYHVRHIALPKPGDWRQFCIQASRTHTRSLDLSRPLWEIYLVEGLDAIADLPPDSFAVLAKIHHAAIDTSAGAEITALLHDTTPVPPASEPPEPWFPESPPGTAQLLLRAAYHNVVQPFMVAAPLTRAVRRLAPVVLGAIGDAWLNPDRLPITRFNGEVSPHRVFETRRFTIDEFKRIRTLVDGATINDAVIAVCGGALRRYLVHHEELPTPGLVAIAPVAVQNDTDDGFAPDPDVLRVPLGTEFEDAVRRLRAIREFTSRIDGFKRAARMRDLTDVSKHAPAATLALSARLLAGAGLGIGRRAPLASCTFANVPGPGEPLYLNGARMSYFSAIMPIYDGMGLVFAVTSYDGRVVISPTSCREQMPDPEFFALCLRESFQEYLELSATVKDRVTKTAEAKAARTKTAKTPKNRKAPKSGKTTKSTRTGRFASRTRRGHAAQGLSDDAATRS